MKTRPRSRAVFAVALAAQLIAAEAPGQPRSGPVPPPGAADGPPAHRLRSTTIELMAWINKETGMKAAAPPTIALLSPAEMLEKYFGEEQDRFPHASTVSGIYDFLNDVIYLPDDFDETDTVQLSNLLHELVHYVQLSAGGKPACLGQLEPPAYHLQIQWLRDQGIADPYSVLGINELTIAMTSVCPE